MNLNPHQPTNQQQFEDYNASPSPSSFSSSSSSPLSSPISSPIQSPSSPRLSLNSNSSENYLEPFLSNSNSDNPVPINQKIFTASDILYSIPSTTTNQPPQTPKQKTIRGSSSIKKTNESPSNQNFNLFVGTHQISVVVLRHQGINGRHPSECKKFYYQARVRNEYPQRHLWSGWASKQEVIDKIQKMFEDEECQLTQVTPTQNPAKRPPKVKNDSGQNEKPSSERNSIRLQRKRDYEMKEDSPQRQKSVRLDDGDDYEPNIRSKPKSKPKLKNVKPQTFSNPQQQHSIQEADTGLWNRTNLPVEYS